MPTGKISGAATMPGVFVVALRARNVDGVSDPVIFTFGIEPSGNVRPSGVLEVYIDLLTKLVSLNAQNFGDSNTKDKGPLFWTKRGDDLVFHITPAIVRGTIWRSRSRHRSRVGADFVKSGQAGKRICAAQRAPRQCRP